MLKKIRDKHKSGIKNCWKKEEGKNCRQSETKELSKRGENCRKFVTSLD